MNRLDRLLAILIHLQSKKRVTAKELAKRFDISIRTVYRDIRSLEAAGIPIGAEPGVGYFLVDGFHLAPIMFTTEEAGALLLAGKLAGGFTDAKTKQNFDSSLYKIKAVLNEEDKKYVSAVEEKINVFTEPDINQLLNDELLGAIQSALYNKQVLQIQYQSSRDQLTARSVEPVSLLFYGNHWHLIAYCRLRLDYRDFRLDRILELTLTDQHFQQVHSPIGEIFKHMFETREQIPTCLRIKKGLAYQSFIQKSWIGIQEEIDLGDRVEISLFTDSLPVLAEWLRPYGADVEILYPPELLAAVEHQQEH